MGGITRVDSGDGLKLERKFWKLDLTPADTCLPKFRKSVILVPYIYDILKLVSSMNTFIFLRM
jgi:hypothetical protein